MAVRDRAARAFDEAGAILPAGIPDALRSALSEATASLETPMRVAVVGRIKAGKSTLMNALLGGPVAPTGPEELTYNVNWFTYADEPGIRVHFTDGRPWEAKPLSWLDRLVTRTSDDTDLLRSIRSVEVGLPREILTRLQLVDTPGLGSFFDDDSRNTLEFLGLTAEHVDGITRENAAEADAVLHLFTRGLAAADHDLVQEFQGSAFGDFSPVNAVAVLTKVDAYWTPDEPDADPIGLADKVARRLAEDPAVARTFYGVLPVCGLLAAGAAGLEAGDVDALEMLTDVPAATLLRRLRFASRFPTADDLPVDTDRRAALIGKLGQYGVWLACRLLRSEGVRRDALPATLLEHSGLARVQDLLLSHFGNRATAIKIAGAVSRCRATATRLTHETSGSAAAAAAVAAGRLEAFEVDEHVLAELALVRALYKDDDRLFLSDEEVHEVATVTGERGTACVSRLGLDPHSTPDELLGVAAERLRYWRRRSEDFGLDSSTVYAIRGVQRSYELIAHRVRAAKRHLEMDP